MKRLVMTRTAQIRLGQLLMILVAWLLFGVLMTAYDHLVLHSGNSRGASEDYSFWFSLAQNTGSGLIGALLGGAMMVFYINVKYRDKPYGQTILAVAVGYVAVIGFIVLILGAVFVPLRTGRPLSDPATQEALGIFLSDTSRIKNIMTWSLVVGLTQLVLQVNNKFGHGTFVNIIRGKYQIPKQEKRIFMFLDLNGSTTIAERLGDERYHMLLKDFFADITNPILDNRGQIYQYVGDEVVIAWSYADGTENGRCVRCFFDIKKSISDAAEKYQSRYGLIPSFKAGIHCGTVVAGEVGIIKRDITYSGDVLNTTSRIQRMCHRFNEEIIASANLLEELRAADQYIFRALGTLKLRGREREIALSAIGPA
jgi:adenylate cyclase